MDPHLDPRKTARLIQHLKDRMDDLPPKLKAAAKYVIDNPGDFGLDTVRTSAQKTGISANSFVRLAQHLGYDTFETFRAPFRAALTTVRDADLGQDWLDRMADGGPAGALQAAAARNQLNITSRSLRLMTAERTQAIVGTLLSARRSYVTATRSSYALAYYFHYVGRMALPGLELVPRHMGAALDDLLEIGARDCLIAVTFAPYSAGTIQALRLAGERGASVILISDSEVIAPGIRTDHVLAVAANSLHPFGAIGGAMAVLECLLTHLIEAGGDQARNRIEAYDALRQDSGAYWSGPKLPRIGR
ncbi:MurR/RpiR family transcriptional regulator [Leisingera methylohalidivorans]|uniref:Sigma factor regulator FecR n=1 Tax=Leisingera methylohalidivorans DSM 14336 TaxID=999552 RepID=V9W347_9RHOB|nr:MurR/RpiR family transcriptional regulator [Leisingera methylohalidivorans]AHD03592.1 sigma factor regulator FecR [Leisingera methylohalidivorans DSM 14336]